jgi:hypothetical protein
MQQIIYSHNNNGVTIVPDYGWQFPTKNYSAEDGIDGTISLFRRNSVCSAEQKIVGIPF